MYIWNDSLIEYPKSRCNWMLSQVQWNFFFLWWFWSLRFFIYFYGMKSCLKTGERRFVRNRPISMMRRRIGCIPSNILQRVKQWKSIQKGWVCFLYSLKTSTRLTDAEPYFCAVYNDIIFQKYINNNKDKTKEILNV